MSFRVKHTFNYLSIFIYFMSLFYLNSCGSSSGESDGGDNTDTGPETPTTVYGAKVMPNLASLPTCTADLEGQLYYLADVSLFKYCASNLQYTDIVLNGTDGTNGQDGTSILWNGALPNHPDNPQLNWAYYNTTDRASYIYNGTEWGIITRDGADGFDVLISISDESSGPNCSNGGKKHVSGLDNGDGGGIARNNILESGEIDGPPEYVCNGDDGTDGFSNLVVLAAEEPGINCSNGGQYIRSGLDDGDGTGTANDNNLQSDEIDDEYYICNGTVSSLVNVTIEAAGPNCVNGGHKIESGLDNGDGGGEAEDAVLHIDEVDQTRFVCNVRDGFSTLVNISDEAAGANCTYSGKRVDSGLDDGIPGGIERNGFLEADEIEVTQFICLVENPNLQVLYTKPENGADLGTSIEVYFNRLVDPSTVSHSSFKVTSVNDEVFGDIKYNGSSVSMSFENHPEMFADYGRQYDITLTTEISDFDGNSLQSDTISSFTTYQPHFNSFKQVSTGSGNNHHTCVITFNSQVKCWGPNSKGQLGLGDTITRGEGVFPYKMTNLSTINLGTGRTVIQVATGEEYSCALLDNGRVKCWGDNSYGQLGQEHILNMGDESGEMGDNLPYIKLDGLVIQISTGGAQSCALLESGSVKCWGRNRYGQLGQGDKITRGDVSGDMGANLLAVDLNGAVAINVVSGESHNCILTDDSKISCWGHNTSGSLGIGSNLHIGDDSDEMGSSLNFVNLASDTNIFPLQISTGGSHTCALLSNEKIKCWGNNTYGQLGIGHNNWTGDNDNEMGDFLPYVELNESAIQIKAGHDHTCAILVSGNIKCWGEGFYGELGVGRRARIGNDNNEMGDNLEIIDLGTGNYVKEILMGSCHTCALLKNGQMKCWGYNQGGQLGLDDKLDRGDNSNEMGDDLPFINPYKLASIQSISAGHYSTCAIMHDGNLKCWGNALESGNGSNVGDQAGEMGNNLPTVDLGSEDVELYTINQVDSGIGYRCALLNNSRVKCWGSGSSGRLGLGDTLSRGVSNGNMGNNLAFVDLGTDASDDPLKIDQLAIGNNHACAVIENKRVKCWGLNNYGQLGLGNATVIGDASSDMGDNLLYVNLGKDVSGDILGVKQITTGDNHSCVILDNGSVKCWGYNTDGQLGIGDTDTRGDASSDMGGALPFVKLGTYRTAKHIVAGESHTCALLDNDLVKCWGSRFYGQLGIGGSIGNPNDIGDAIDEMGDDLDYVDLGDGRTAMQISAGADSTCAVLDNGIVKCWGENWLGQLGLGDTFQRSRPTAVNIGKNRSAQKISVGKENNVCVLLNDHQVKCWGTNHYGKLGLGNDVNKGGEKNDMGDYLPLVFLGTLD